MLIYNNDNIYHYYIIIHYNIIISILLYDYRPNHHHHSHFTYLTIFFPSISRCCMLQPHQEISQLFQKSNKTFLGLMCPDMILTVAKYLL